MSGIYLGKWRWHAQESDQDESMWIAPAGTISTIDLRPIDQCAAAGSEGGPGLFSCDDDPGPEHDAIALGDNPAMIMSDAIRSEWQARTGASVRQGAAISEAIWDALTVQADPTGTARPAPILPGSDGRARLYLRDNVADPIQSTLRKCIRLENDDERWPNVLQAYRQIYAETRDKVSAGDAKQDLHRMFLARWQQIHRTTDYRQFVGGDLPDESPVKPKTVISDDFDRANADPMSNSAEGWAGANQNGGHEIVSQTAHGKAGQSRARAEIDLSFVNHESTIEQLASSGLVAGSIARCSSSADTCYRAIRTNTTTVQIAKIITGTVTALAFGTATASLPRYQTIRVNGSTIECMIGTGGAIATTTDTSIPGNTRIGIAGNATSVVDNFSGTDVIVVPVMMANYRRRRAA